MRRILRLWVLVRIEVDKYYRNVMLPRAQGMAQYPPKVLDSRLDEDGHTEYHVLFCSGKKDGNHLRYESEWMSGDDPLVTAAPWDQFYRENPDAVMSDLSDEDEDSGDEDDSEIRRRP